MRVAVALFRQYAPDVTPMDIGMPRMNGVEAIRAVRRHILSKLDASKRTQAAMTALRRGLLHYV